MLGRTQKVKGEIESGQPYCQETRYMTAPAIEWRFSGQIKPFSSVPTGAGCLVDRKTLPDASCQYRLSPLPSGSRITSPARKPTRIVDGDGFDFSCTVLLLIPYSSGPGGLLPRPSMPRIGKSPCAFWPTYGLYFRKDIVFLQHHEILVTRMSDFYSGPCR